MTLNSALEDLRDTTLRALTGTLRKLRYLAGLRDESGNYQHWGLSRLHGEPAAAKAMVEEHRLLVSEVLATPIQQLLADVEESSLGDGVSAENYVDKLTHETGLLPPQPGPGTEKHLNSVLCALSSLTKTKAAEKPGANPPVS